MKQDLNGQCDLTKKNLCAQVLAVLSLLCWSVISGGAAFALPHSDCKTTLLHSKFVGLHDGDTILQL